MSALGLFGHILFRTRRLGSPCFPGGVGEGAVTASGQSAENQLPSADCFPHCILDGSFHHANRNSAGAVNSSPGKAGDFTAPGTIS